MKHRISSKVRKGIWGASLLYLVLCVLRFIYLQIEAQDFGLTENSIQGQSAMKNEGIGSYNEAGKKTAIQNFASDRRVMDAVGATKQVTIDQKYERVGFVSSYTDNFEGDKVKVNTLISGNKGIVQIENNSGVTGKRVLELSIGVLPENFDAFIESAKGIGEIYDFRVEKRDKTSEYKDLKAKQLTLEKMRDALNALKEQGGNINDRINLENKVLEVEEKIQDLGVSLGNFKEENELCTVKLNLYERKYKKVEKALSYGVIAKNIVASLIWVLGYYCGLLVMIILAGLSSYVLLLVLNKFKETLSTLSEKKDPSKEEEENKKK